MKLQALRYTWHRMLRVILPEQLSQPMGVPRYSRYYPWTLSLIIDRLIHQWPECFIGIGDMRPPHLAVEYYEHIFFGIHPIRSRERTAPCIGARLAILWLVHSIQHRLKQFFCNLRVQAQFFRQRFSIRFDTCIDIRQCEGQQLVYFLR